MQTATPNDLTIIPRDRRFGRDRSLGRWWLGGNPVLSAVFNALSVTFPKGEAFFIDSVRRHRDGVPEPLASDIAAFTKQEVVHSREHLAFNRRVVDAGYDVTRQDRLIDQRLAVLAQQPAIVSLAATIALEHFTAILAHSLLADPRLLDGADRESADLWRWHAIEEIEHKGVAYDTWLHATRDWPRFRRWSVKSRVMLLITANFIVDRTRGILDLLAQDGLKGPRVWGRLAWVMFGKPGMLRRVTIPWMTYFLPRFHPWNHDDRPLIAKTERAYAVAA